MNGPLLRQCRLSDSEILRYRRYGAGKKKLVLVHGLAARSETWIDLIPLFPRDKYTLYLLDLLGSGESTKPEGADYSIRAHGHRLINFLERKGLVGVTLVGHSLGGAVVLFAAIEAIGRDEIINSVVIMAGPGFIQRLPLMARIFRIPLTGPLFMGLPTSDAWVRYGLRAAYYNQQLVDQQHVDRYLSCYRDRDAKLALIRTCRQLVPPDCAAIYDCYAKLQLPVLLLWGRQDRIIPLSQGERLKREIPGAQLKVIEDCGHNLQEEKPEETFSIMDSFLSRCCRSWQEAG